MGNFCQKANDALFDEVEKDVSRAEEFVRTQLQRAIQMNDEANQLIQHYQTVKTAGKLLYGEETIAIALKKAEDPVSDIRSAHSDELLIMNKPKAGKSFHQIILSSSESRPRYPQELGESRRPRRSRRTDPLHGWHDWQQRGQSIKQACFPCIPWTSVVYIRHAELHPEGRGRKRDHPRGLHAFVPIVEHSKG